jgi:nucleoside-diphosphate-sugar epimerase
MDRRPLLLLGANSLVAHWLLPRLAAAGWQALTVGRSASAMHRADLGRPDTLNALPAAGHAISLAPLWLLPAALPALRQSGVRRLLAFGSTSAVGKAASPDAKERAVAQRLAEAEAALFAAAAEAGIAVTLFRPTLIYDGLRDGNVARLAALLGRWHLLPLVGGGRGLRQPVHADDLAVACLQALEASTSHGRRYDLPGGETLSYKEMARRIAAARGIRAWLPTVPAWLARALFAVARRLPGFTDISLGMVLRPAQDLVFDGTPAQRDFGYAPGLFRP